LLSLGAIRNYAVELIRRYGVLTPGPDLRASSLSGGNLQKLVLGREFSGAPKVLVAASPTRGLDVGAIEGVHAYLRDAAAGGVALLLISEDLDEIMALSDRVEVIYEGEITGPFDPSTATVEEIGLAMAGGERA
jgi:simple sugar transport system ATP-binding protein